MHLGFSHDTPKCRGGPLSLEAPLSAQKCPWQEGVWWGSWQVPGARAGCGAAPGSKGTSPRAPHSCRQQAGCCRSPQWDAVCDGAGATAGASESRALGMGRARRELSGCVWESRRFRGKNREGVIRLWGQVSGPQCTLCCQCTSGGCGGQHQARWWGVVAGQTHNHGRAGRAQTRRPLCDLYPPGRAARLLPSVYPVFQSPLPLTYHVHPRQTWSCSGPGPAEPNPTTWGSGPPMWHWTGILLRLLELLDMTRAGPRLLLPLQWGSGLSAPLHSAGRSPSQSLQGHSMPSWPWRETRLSGTGPD